MKDGTQEKKVENKRRTIKHSKKIPSGKPGGIKKIWHFVSEKILRATTEKKMMDFTLIVAQIHL